MLLTVDPAASQPLFEQLVASIRHAVVSGSLSAGERLPAARDLASSLDINLHTVLRAYQVLRDEGFIELRRGRGAVVTERTADYQQLMGDIERLVIEARRLELTRSALTDLSREAWT